MSSVSTAGGSGTAGVGGTAGAAFGFGPRLGEAFAAAGSLFFFMLAK
jgi:hypothetical protein